MPYHGSAFRSGTTCDEGARTKRSHPERSRGWFAATAAFVAALVLASCAPGAPGQQGSDASGEKKLTYLYITDGPDEQVTRNLIAQFERKTGAKVELQLIPLSELEQQLQARLSGGNPPDVARMTNIRPYRGDLFDLEKYVPKLGDQFFDQARRFVTGQRGALVAVPSDLTVNGPFLNVDLFRRAGVTPPPVTRPWTWAQLVANATKVQKATGTPYAIAYDKSGHRVSGMFSQYGTSFFGADGKVALDSTKATAAVSTFVDLAKRNVIPRDFWLEHGTKYKGANDIFLAQDAPVYFSGNWQVSQFAKSAKFNWAAMPNPCQAACGGYPGGKFMGGFQAGKNRKLTAQFIAFMNSRSSQEQFAKASALLPTRKDLLAEGVRYPSRSADMAVFQADLKRIPDATYVDNYSEGFDRMAAAVVKELEKAIAGQQTPARAVANMRTEADKISKAASKVTRR